jgi:glycosyltransferase involved in cell wall biosynthesis
LLVSVIVPVYNVAPYLREALDSVVNQTYKDLEIIIVEDGSTDGSADICEEYADSDARIKLIKQPNKGLSGARNTGLEIATGDLVAFVDSDDSISPLFVELLVSAMISSDSQIGVCRCSFIYSNGSMNGVASSVFPTISNGIYERADAYRLLVEETMSVNVCNKLFRREFFSDVRFAEGHVYEDAYPCFKLFDKAERIVLVDEPLYNYRRRPDSITALVSMNNINDCLLAHNCVSDLIRQKWSDIIPESLYLKKHQKIVTFLILSYIKLIKSGTKDISLERELRALILKTKREVGIKTLEPKAKIYYYVIKVCPALMRVLRH